MESRPQELPDVYETMKVSLVFAMPFLLKASMLPERAVIGCVLLFLGRCRSLHLKSQGKE
ncbi:MAG TPA: hypothetical protein VJ733_07365 [Candidatus Binatia bacterium]|nr:hypothetical protein [Candidatus Binatia bacterium]